MALLVVACDGTADLEAAKSSASNGNLLANADRQISCNPSGQSCAQLYRTKADACLRLAQDEVAAAKAGGAVAQSRSGCAVESYATALKSLPDPNGTIGAGQLAAFRVARQVSATTAAGRNWNRSLAQGAGAYSTSHPGRNPGPYYAADSLFWNATISEVDRCANLTRAGSLAVEARAAKPVPGSPDLTSSIVSLQNRTKSSATRNGCV